MHLLVPGRLIWKLCGVRQKWNKNSKEESISFNGIILAMNYLHLMMKNVSRQRCHLVQSRNCVVKCHLHIQTFCGTAATSWAQSHIWLKPLLENIHLVNMQTACFSPWLDIKISFTIIKYEGLNLLILVILQLCPWKRCKYTAARQLQCQRIHLQATSLG